MHTMLDRFLMLASKNRDSESISDDEPTVGLRIKIPRPEIVRYSIGRESTSGRRAHLRKGTFEFSEWGKVDWPEEFAGAHCNVMVNPLAGTGYEKYRQQGFLGDGRCNPSGSEFIVRLYVSPSVVRDILLRNVMAPRSAETGPEVSGDSHMFITIATADFSNTQKSNEVWFKVVHAIFS